MICKAVLCVLVVAYLGALFVLATGTFGWFGQERDPLSGVFLMPLGLPWVLIKVPESFNIVLAICAPLINIALIGLLCRKLGS